MLSLEGTYFASNGRLDASALTGPGSLVGKSFNDIYAPEAAQQYKRKLDEVITKEMPVDFEIEMKKSNGLMYLQERLYPVYRDGKLWAVGGICRDMTEQHRLQQERLKLQQDLHQAQKMEAIGTLAGGIAHDFNNILSSVIGFTELALDDAEQGTTLHDSLQEVYSAGKRAKDLVRQILAYARQSEESSKPIQVDIIVKEVLKLIRSSTPTSIDISQAIESDSFVMGHPTQFHQIVMNLCTNAAHAMDEKGGVLAVALKDTRIDGSSGAFPKGLKPGDYIEMVVSDTGPGIPPEIMDSIFEPYFTTKGPGEGTGMGLAVVHGIVEKLGGKIIVTSQQQKGSIFRVFLPITQKPEAQRSYEPKALPTGTESILFVDDEAAIAKMIAQMLSRLGYSVITRTSSIEALELFRSKPNDFDLVITDMTMPTMTGDLLAVDLMAIRHDIPIILCTGYSNRITDEIAAGIGIKSFAHKPIVMKDLAKTVRKVLDEAKG